MTEDKVVIVKQKTSRLTWVGTALIGLFLLLLLLGQCAGPTRSGSSMDAGGSAANAP
jgi:hypothetical protein